MGNEIVWTIVAILGVTLAATIYFDMRDKDE